MARYPLLDGTSDAAGRTAEGGSTAVELNDVLGRSPGLWRRTSALIQWYRSESALSPRLQELLILLVGYHADSSYEVSQHISKAIASGVSEPEIRVLQRHKQDGLELSGFSALEALALRAALEIMENENVTEETWRLLTETCSIREVIELCHLVATYWTSAILIDVWQLQVEPAQQADLDRFPIL